MDFWGYFQMRRRTILTAALGLLAALTIAGCSAPTTVTPPAE
jgi:predicted small secreted protein